MTKMTREEATELLKQYNLYSPTKQIEEAIDMAIEALQTAPTPCEKCIHVKSCRKVIILKNRTYKLVKYCSQGVERREPYQERTEE